MELFEMAKALGQALKADERLVAFETAKANYEADEELQKLSSEYQIQQLALGQEMAKAERDTLLLDSLQGRVDELYRLISERASYQELLRTQQAVNELMNQINRTIETEISGEEPRCTHDCSTCGGCH